MLRMIENHNMNPGPKKVEDFFMPTFGAFGPVVLNRHTISGPGPLFFALPLTEELGGGGAFLETYDWKTKMATSFE